MKYYRALQDSFLWHKGAILKNDGDGYRPISDLWDTTEHNGEEYITARIVENNPEWFERVYEISVLGKAKYLTREAARAYHDKAFKSK